MIKAVRNWDGRSGYVADADEKCRNLRGNKRGRTYESAPEVLMTMRKKYGIEQNAERILRSPLFHYGRICLFTTGRY